MPQFAELCGEFLRFQLQTVKPRLIVVMGPDARESFDVFGKSSYSARILYTTHPYADFNFSAQRLATDVAVSITFPVCETNQCVGERSQPALLKPAWE